MTSVAAERPSARAYAGGVRRWSGHRRERRFHPLPAGEAAHVGLEEHAGAERLGEDELVARRQARRMRISGAASAARPNTAKPATSSGPVVVWPPTSVTCSASSAARAPTDLVQRLLGLLGSVSGTDTCARAKRGATPLAQRSLVALTAATRPTRYGSSVKARKLSTLDTITSPRGVATAATSSRSCRPSRTAGSTGAPIRSRARDSTDSPTLAAQPPQSISSPPAIFAGRELGSRSPSGASTWKRRMKRRSIQSLSANTARPSDGQPPLGGDGAPVAQIEEREEIGLRPVGTEAPAAEPGPEIVDQHGPLADRVDAGLGQPGWPSRLAQSPTAKSSS